MGLRGNFGGRLGMRIYKCFHCNKIMTVLYGSPIHFIMHPFYKKKVYFCSRDCKSAIDRTSIEQSK